MDEYLPELQRYAPELQKYAPVEMTTPVLTVIQNMNLGLAQECFFQKAILGKRRTRQPALIRLDRMKDATTSKIATRVGELFTLAAEQAEQSKEVFHAVRDRSKTGSHRV